MGPIGVQEMIGIFLIALLLFGPKKLPELGRMLGKALHEFRRAKSELRSTFETHMRELEREVNTAQSPTRSLAAPDYSSNDYGSSGRYSSPYEYVEDQYQPETVATPVDTASSHSEPEPVATNGHGTFAAPAVAGTVPRSNGTHPIATDEQERLA